MQKKLTILEIENKKYIIVENEGFDWEIEPEQLRKVEISIKNDPVMKENFIGNMLNHFVTCFSDFLGKKITLKEINEALDKGYIEV
jgi:hypothetical protein